LEIGLKSTKTDVLTHGVIPSFGPLAQCVLSGYSVEVKRLPVLCWGQTRRDIMELYVGLDVSLKETSICVVDRDGQLWQKAQ